MDVGKIKQTADLLKQLSPGFLPYPIFAEIARIVTLPIIEFIPLRKRGGVIEVLLLERPQNDPLWPGAKHTPGTVIRATDLGPSGAKWAAFERILNEELKGTAVSEPYFVGSILHESKRGTEQAQLYWVEVLAKPKVGDFYPVSSLPPEFIESQRSFLLAALRSFEQSHGD